MYERRRRVNQTKERQQRANWYCHFQQIQEAGSLGEYGYLSKHENVFLAEEEV